MSFELTRRGFLAGLAAWLGAGSAFRAGAAQAALPFGVGSWAQFAGEIVDWRGDAFGARQEYREDYTALLGPNTIRRKQRWVLRPNPTPDEPRTDETEVYLSIVTGDVGGGPGEPGESGYSFLPTTLAVAPGAAFSRFQTDWVVEGDDSAEVMGRQLPIWRLVNTRALEQPARFLDGVPHRRAIEPGGLRYLYDQASRYIVLAEVRTTWYRDASSTGETVDTLRLVDTNLSIGG